MDARFERYIENLRTVRTLSQPKFSPDMKAKELLETIQSNAIKCFDCMKEDNAILNELVLQRAPAELTRAEIASLLNYILVAHKPTYVHSMMVAGLTRMFVKQMLKKSPELFVGVMGCRTVEEVRRDRIEICELAYECGLYHDVGKSYVFVYIGNNYRRLLDDEDFCRDLKGTLDETRKSVYLEVYHVKR